MNRLNKTLLHIALLLPLFASISGIALEKTISQKNVSPQCLAPNSRVKKVVGIVTEKETQEYWKQLKLDEGLLSREQVKSFFLEQFEVSKGNIEPVNLNRIAKSLQVFADKYGAPNISSEFFHSQSLAVKIDLFYDYIVNNHGKFVAFTGKDESGQSQVVGITPIFVSDNHIKKSRNVFILPSSLNPTQERMWYPISQTGIGNEIVHQLGFQAQFYAENISRGYPGSVNVMTMYRPGGRTESVLKLIQTASTIGSVTDENTGVGAIKYSYKMEEMSLENALKAQDDPNQEVAMIAFQVRNDTASPVRHMGKTVSTEYDITPVETYVPGLEHGNPERDDSGQLVKKYFSHDLVDQDGSFDYDLWKDEELQTSDKILHIVVPKNLAFYFNNGHVEDGVKRKAVEKNGEIEIHLEYEPAFHVAKRSMTEDANHSPVVARKMAQFLRDQAAFNPELVKTILTSILSNQLFARAGATENLLQGENLLRLTAEYIRSLKGERTPEELSDVVLRVQKGEEPSDINLSPAGEKRARLLTKILGSKFNFPIKTHWGVTESKDQAKLIDFLESHANLFNPSLVDRELDGDFADNKLVYLNPNAINEGQSRAVTNLVLNLQKQWVALENAENGEIMGTISVRLLPINETEATNSRDIVRRIMFPKKDTEDDLSRDETELLSDTLSHLDTLGVIDWVVIDDKYNAFGQMLMAATLRDLILARAKMLHFKTWAPNEKPGTGPIMMANLKAHLDSLGTRYLSGRDALIDQSIAAITYTQGDRGMTKFDVAVHSSPGRNAAEFVHTTDIPVFREYNVNKGNIEGYIQNPDQKFSDFFHDPKTKILNVKKEGNVTKVTLEGPLSTEHFDALFQDPLLDYYLRYWRGFINDPNAPINEDWALAFKLVKSQLGIQSTYVPTPQVAAGLIANLLEKQAQMDPTTLLLPAHEENQINTSS